MNTPWGRVKPGWILLVILMAYGVVTTVLLQRINVEVRQLRVAEATSAAAAPVPETTAAPAQNGLWFPLPGASLPTADEHLPGAERPYRNGVSQGFDFYDDEAGIPVPYGAPVIASASGVLARVDNVYNEMDPTNFETMLADVAESGATEEQLDRLRGRQVWLRTDDGRTLRYAHLSAIRPGLASGQTVYRGQVLARVGNSGTDAGVAGTERAARLHFEIWDDGGFFGEGLAPEAVRVEAASLFTGP